MKRLLKEIEQALNSGLYLLALQSCATLPDICGALMSKDGVASPGAYKTWYDQYGQKFLKCSLPAEDCYLFRNSILHQAKTVPSPRKSQTATYSRIIFTLPETNNNVLHNNIINGGLNLDLIFFCKGMITATEKWIEDMEKTKDTNYIKNITNFVDYYPTGLEPYIKGMPLIT